ncbi:MAG: response regulator [Acidobacteria bacterium]|nr:response regulator [Acidobacteriota bacterium]
MEKRLPIRVLMVEEDALFAWCVQRYLAPHGFQVVIADRVWKVVQEMGVHRFDLVISDYRLGDSGGRELLKQVKRIQPQVPVLLVTAMERDEIAFPDTGLAEAYLNKPVELLALKKTAQRLVVEKDGRAAAEGNLS